MELKTDSDLYAIIKLSASFGKHNNLIWAYIELFGVTPMKGKTKKIRMLLEEMKALFEVQAFRYQHKQYGISQAGIAEALNITVHRHFETPLESHNYLKKIMIGISEKEGNETGKQAERDLRKREDRMKYEFPEERVDGTPSLNPSHQGREGKEVNHPHQGREEKEDSPPSMGGDKGEGESQHPTPEQIAANKLRLKDLIKSMG